MNIVITGSLGRISKPLVQALIEKGNNVTVISSTVEREAEIAALGATPAIGSLTDSKFLAQIFTGADIVYLMEPPVNFTDPDTNIIQEWLNIASSYVSAVKQSGVTKLIHLSSIGAHTDKSNGILKAHYYVENMLRELPEDITIKFVRPVGFYYNMFAFIPSIKATGCIYQNYSGEIKEPWVSPLDIAAVIAEEMVLPFSGRTVRYVASEELTGNDVAKILGEAIGQAVKWVEIPDAVFEEGLINASLTVEAAKGLTEMNAARRGDLCKDYYKYQPELGNVKVVDFAKDFAAVFNQ